jgi:hypothetical protein
MPPLLLLLFNGIFALFVSLFPEVDADLVDGEDDLEDDSSNLGHKTFEGSVTF